MLIGLMLITFVMLWVICFILFERDLVCPAMLLISGYTLSVGVAFVSDFFIPFTYHVGTFFVLFVGTVMFLIPAYVFKCVYLDNQKICKRASTTLVEISPIALFLHALFVCGVIALTLFTYVSFLQKYGMNVSLFSSIPAMRNFGINHPGGGPVSEFFIVNQLRKVFFVTGYFLLLLWARNVVIRRSFVKDNFLLLNCLLALALIATEGGRGGIVSYVLAGAALLFFFEWFYNGMRLRITISLLVKIFLAFVVCVLIFYGWLFITGRHAGAFTLSGAFSHASFYLGGSIPLLDNFLLTNLMGGVLIFLEKKFFSDLSISSLSVST